MFLKQINALHMSGTTPDHAHYAPFSSDSIGWSDNSSHDDSVYQPKGQAPRPRFRWGLMLVGGLLALSVAAGGSFFAVQRAFTGKIYPNITIQGIPVGSLTPDQAEAELQKRYAPFLQQPITLNYGAQHWQPSLSELGVRLEIERAIESAIAVGREQAVFGNMQAIVTTWQHGTELPLHLTIDQATTQHYLLARAAEIERPAQDADLIFSGLSTATVLAVPGSQLEVETTLNELVASLQTLQPQSMDLRTRELAPDLTDSEVAAARTQIAAFLQGPLTITIADKPYTLSLEELARMIRIEKIAAATDEQLQVTVDHAQLRRYLQTIADETAVKGAYPQVDWNNGDLSIIREGTPDLRIDLDQAEASVLATAATPNRTVNLTLAVAKPMVTKDNLAQLGITNLIAVGQSDFTGSAAYRVTNIQVGMRLMHGLLIAPGEEFSFNKAVGNIDESNGFVEGYAIIKNRTQLEFGGGICQVSTTMFRAAFWAGLPITERWGHSFYISWYDRYAFDSYGNGPGMDATIFTGGPDFKFLNDTGHWLLIQTMVDVPHTLAEIRIYGTATGRTVELAGRETTNRKPAPAEPVFVAEPKTPRGRYHQSDHARGGMDITFTRVVKQDGNEVDRQTFLTRFKPWPNIFEINPADLGPDGHPSNGVNVPGMPTAVPTATPADGTQPVPSDGSLPATTPLPGDGSLPATTPLPGDGSLPATTPLPGDGSLPAATPLPGDGSLPATTPLPGDGSLPATTPLPGDGSLPAATPLPGDGSQPTAEPTNV